MGSSSTLDDRRVAFFFPGHPDLDALRDVDPDRDVHRFRTGPQAWILQTYARLRRAGHPVGLVERIPRDGVVVFHAKHRREVVARWPRGGRAVLVATRADVRSAAIEDFEVLQNGCFVDGRRRFHVPHWPQPGLVPRDPSRGSGVRTVAFRGLERNLHPDFRSARWREALERRGLEWRTDSATFDAASDARYDVDWSSYRDVDVVVAVRPDARDAHRSKPASKLINAWLAGVPAVLGHELAYRELRTSPLDYDEARSVDEALAAIDRLASEPELYATKVAHGRTRGREFDADATLARWERLLFDTIPSRLEDPPIARRRRLGLRARRWLGLARRYAGLEPGR